MSSSAEVKIILDESWKETDLPTKVSIERHHAQIVASVKEEDVLHIVNQFLSDKKLGGMVLSHIPPYKPPHGTKICDKCNGKGTIPTDE